jgi:hypothetical protein
MSTLMSEPYRQAIRGALMCRAGNATDSGVVAEATLDIWHRMADSLAPVIGVRGVEVLFSHSMHLINRLPPRLAAAEDPGNHVALLASLKERLAVSTAQDAMDLSHTLLVTFTELLSTLIGESLTERLLRPVWELPPPPPTQEIVS